MAENRVEANAHNAGGCPASNAIHGHINDFLVRTGLRSSSVLVDNIRWQSYLSSMTSAEAEEWGVDDDQRRFFVRFGVSKANYGAPFADRWFRRHDGGVLKPAVLERQRKSKGVPRGEA